MQCLKCEDFDLSLVGYAKLDEDLFEVAFECRQCGHEFTAELTESQLNNWR